MWLRGCKESTENLFYETYPDVSALNPNADGDTKKEHCNALHVELGPHVPSRLKDTNPGPAFEWATETLFFSSANFFPLSLAPEPPDGNPHRHTWARTHLIQTQGDNRAILEVESTSNRISPTLYIPSPHRHLYRRKQCLLCRVTWVLSPGEYHLPQARPCEMMESISPTHHDSPIYHGEDLYSTCIKWFEAKPKSQCHPWQYFY